METNRTQPRKRGKRSFALTIRMTEEMRLRLDEEATRTGLSLATIVEQAVDAGFFWRAFQRTVMAEAAATPSAEEIKAALRTMEALKARMAA